MNTIYKINILLYDNYELLDVMGPIEMITTIPGVELDCFSISGGYIKSFQNIKIETKKKSEITFKKDDVNIILIPGGRFFKEMLKDNLFIETINFLTTHSDFCLTICTGSALLAKTGLLNGKTATTNKQAWNWIKDNFKKVNWIRKARWCIDKKYYTSSGVSAGTDMVLQFILNIFGKNVLNNILKNTEYIWHNQPDNDPFAEDYNDFILI